jgi:hypothetical protein
MSLGLEALFPPQVIQLSVQIALCLSLCVAPASAQKQPAGDNATPPKYDLHSETKTQGVVDEVKLSPFGSRKDFTELVVRNGTEKLRIYVCPKPFEEEMGITFSKGDRVDVTGSKVKQEDAEIILARQVVKGTDTLMFRDDKGNPVWDWRTGK